MLHRPPSPLALYAHTLRHLRPSQFWHRARFCLTRPRLRDTNGLALRTMAPDAFVAQPRGAAAMIGPRSFRFLGERGELPPHGGWGTIHGDKLWRYNLHYFDDLTAKGAISRNAWHRALIARWITENPPGAGEGWEPYPLSLRLVNWFKWLWAGNEPVAGMIASLAAQADWLSQRIEWHLLGNHLFANAKALIFAGAAFDGPVARRWADAGSAILNRELSEQVLADGGHFERSPMYHAIILGDVLDLANLARASDRSIDPEIVGALRAVVPAMLYWLKTMTHPDGGIGFFNDAALGIAPDWAGLATYAVMQGFGTPQDSGSLIELRESGYLRLAAGKAVALLDVAPVGPDYLPGHAHADTLSFELSVGEQRVIVNGGTSRYGTGAARLRERGTPAHSTVTIAGADSSEVWSGFRVARRAQPFGVSITKTGEAMRVCAAHDGYRRLPGRPDHHREWTMEAGCLVVTDRIEARGSPPPSVARYHLHPDIVASEAGVGSFRLALPDGTSMRARCEEGHASLIRSSHSPGFGIVQPTHAIEVELEDGRGRLLLDWSAGP